MRGTLWLLCLVSLVVMTGFTVADTRSVSVGPGHRTVAQTGRLPCGGTLYMNADGSYESANAWSGPFPAWCTLCGGFAECYQAGVPTLVYGIQVVLTTQGGPPTKIPPDVYVWADAGGQPGAILGSFPSSTFAPFGVAVWPASTVVDLCFPTPVSVPVGSYWVGYQDPLSGSPGHDYLMCMDLDGFGGCPYTYSPPPGGGWQSVSIPWGPTQALGIAVWSAP